MIEFENTETSGWEAAIRGMRNPLESWGKGDTAFWSYPEEGVAHEIGKNDLDLMKRLIKAGTDHRKFMRMVTVYVDITAPLYWWKEFDTYKVGTVANSCSTMHTIHKRPIEVSDFSHDGGFEGVEDVLSHTCTLLNCYREEYLEDGNKEAWRSLIQTLPSSYNQKRTVMMNYEVLRNAYRSREGHKLSEWQEFREWVETLPHSGLITDK